MTRVSVMIPARNASATIASAIESVLNQSLTDFELVVCEDASTDTTREVLSHFSDSRLRVLPSDKPNGMIGNWNRCLQMARAELILVFHADDLLYPNYLQAVVAAFDQNPSVGMVVPECAIFRGENILRPPEVCKFRGHLLTRGYPAVRFLINGVPFGSGVTIRKECHRELGGFNEDLPYSADEEYWCRIGSFYDIYHIPEQLGAVRLHQTNCRYQIWLRDDCMDKYVTTLSLAISHLQWSSSQRAELEGVVYNRLGGTAYGLGRWCYCEGHHREAINYLRRSLSWPARLPRRVKEIGFLIMAMLNLSLYGGLDHRQSSPGVTRRRENKAR